jgi:hypothetical protein
MQRDALNYHVAAAQPLVEVTLYAPDLVDDVVRAAIRSGLEFIRPYFLGLALTVFPDRDRDFPICWKARAVRRTRGLCVAGVAAAPVAGLSRRTRGRAG